MPISLDEAPPILVLELAIVEFDWIGITGVSAYGRFLHATIPRSESSADAIRDALRRSWWRSVEADRDQAAALESWRQEEVDNAMA